MKVKRGVPPFDTPLMLFNTVLDLLAIGGYFVMGYFLYEAEDHVMLIALKHKDLKGSIGSSTYLPGLLCFLIMYVLVGSCMCRLSQIASLQQLLELQSETQKELSAIFGFEIISEPVDPWIKAIQPGPKKDLTERKEGGHSGWKRMPPKAQRKTLDLGLDREGKWTFVPIKI